MEIILSSNRMGVRDHLLLGSATILSSKYNRRERDQLLSRSETYLDSQCTKYSDTIVSTTFIFVITSTSSCIRNQWKKKTSHISFYVKKVCCTHFCMEKKSINVTKNSLEIIQHFVPSVAPQDSSIYHILCNWNM